MESGFKEEGERIGSGEGFWKDIELTYAAFCWIQFTYTVELEVSSTRRKLECGGAKRQLIPGCRWHDLKHDH